MSRIALLVFVLGLSASPVLADHYRPDCPLTLVGTNPPSTSFELSPHGVFRSMNLVYVLHGQTLTTYNATDLGDLQIVREDFVGSMGARETNAGIAFDNGFLYISSDAGLEIYDLRNTRAGGTAPLLVSRTRGIHGRRLAVNGNRLAVLYPIIDLPCVPSNNPPCTNAIEIYDVSNRSNPTLTTTIAARTRSHIAYNDIAFNFGYLFATGEAGTYAFNISDVGVTLVRSNNYKGKYLVTNSANILGVINDQEIEIFSVNSDGNFSPVFLFTIPAYLTIERDNPVHFSRHAWIDDANGRLITVVNEWDPFTRSPARSIAFDVFDFSVPMWEGSAERPYENLSYITTDEVKYNPVAVGPFVYTVGEMSGLQTWGGCGQVAGRIEMDSVTQLPCSGAEIHGWVTGTQKIANVELFLDGGAIGAATLGLPRRDVSSRTPVTGWRLNVNFENVTRGEHLIRAVGTDILGNRRQFASQRVFFPGPGSNCMNRRRSSGAR